MNVKPNSMTPKPVPEDQLLDQALRPKTFDEYIDWYIDLTRESLRVLKDTGNMFLVNYPKQTQLAMGFTIMFGYITQTWGILPNALPPLIEVSCIAKRRKIANSTKIT